MSGSRPSSKEMKFYSKLRRTVKIWAGGEQSTTNQYADVILAGPDLFMLLVRLSRDQRVSQWDRASLAGAAAYFINPLDFIPEIILGPPGLVDDIALSAFVLHEVLENTDPVVVREHWDGDADILDLIRRILAVADTMVGGAIWRRLVAMAQSFIPTP
jgi:uncharacterized membrane protein YkvA (DUF1232 family)